MPSHTSRALPERLARRVENNEKQSTGAHSAKWSQSAKVSVCSTEFAHACAKLDNTCYERCGSPF